MCSSIEFAGWISTDLAFGKASKFCFVFCFNFFADRMGLCMSERNGMVTDDRETFLNLFLGMIIHCASSPFLWIPDILLEKGTLECAF